MKQKERKEEWRPPYLSEDEKERLQQEIDEVTCDDIGF